MRARAIRLTVFALALTTCTRAGDDRVIHSVIPNASGVRDGATVTFRGVEVGRVERVTFDSSGVRLAIRIVRADMPLRAQDRVAVRSMGLFGDMQVEIQPGPLSAPPVGDGATLPAAPADTLAGLRTEVVTAILGAGLAQLRDSTHHASRPAAAVRPVPSRP